MTPLSAPFYIDTISGVIRVKTSLDRETVDNYTLNVTATDRDRNIVDRKSSSVNVTITLTDANDNDPVFSPDHYKVRRKRPVKEKLDKDCRTRDIYYSKVNQHFFTPEWGDTRRNKVVN